MAEKLLFLDIDNTLLTADRRVTEENSAAICEAISRGHRVIIASGRPLGGILPLAKELGLAGHGCYIIAFNGGQLYDCGAERMLFEETLTLPDVRILFSQAEKYGLHIQTYEDSTVLVKQKTPELDWYSKRIGVPARVVPGLPDGMVKEPVKALIASLTDHARLEACRLETAPLLAGRVSLFFSCAELLECVKEGVSKGTAVVRLAELLGVPLADTIAAGDSENDIPMLRAAGTGCAMANGTAACKDAADYITERDCNHSGVAEIIRKFML